MTSTPSSPSLSWASEARMECQAEFIAPRRRLDEVDTTFLTSSSWVAALLISLEISACARGDDTESRVRKVEILIRCMVHIWLQEVVGDVRASSSSICKLGRWWYRSELLLRSRRGKVNLPFNISNPPTIGPILEVTTPSGRFYPNLVVPIKDFCTHICTQ